jgi:hypothetical protein
MKKIIVLFVILLSLTSFAQSAPQDDIALIQDIYGKSKTDLINQYMKLSEPQAAAFKTIYDDYEAARKGLGQKKVQLLNDYAASYETLDDAKAAELTEANLKTNAEIDKLLSKTYNKVKKAIGGRNAAKFVQLEQYLQVAIRSGVQDAIPFIDEIDKTKINK